MVADDLATQGARSSAGAFGAEYGSSHHLAVLLPGFAINICQQAITQANVGPCLFNCVASPGHNKLK